MTKPSGAQCNLDCRYCFYLEKEALYPGSSFRMSPAMLETYVQHYIASQPGPEVAFAWQGGEPTLMGLDYFKQAVALQKRHCPPGKTVSNALQTNGLLLDDAWCAFFKEEGFLIGLSLDGPQPMHDAARVGLKGEGSFERVIQGLALLRKHGVEFNTLCVVGKHNSGRPLEVYEFLKDCGSAFLQFIPLVEREGSGVSADSVFPEDYGAFLCAIYDRWIKSDVGRVYVQLFEVSLAIWQGLPSPLCIFSETCGRSLVLEHNGDLYSCDHFVEPEHRLGNIAQAPLAELALSPQQQAFGRAKRERLPKACLDCDVRFACNGECPKNRFALSPDGEAGLNYLCAAYKRFFRHIDPGMRAMSALLDRRQSPALVMQAGL